MLNRFLFVLLFLGAAGIGAAGEPIAAETSIAELMSGIVTPTADVLWGASAVYLTEEGEDDRSPRSAEAWQKVEAARARLAEATTALLDLERPVDSSVAGEDHPPEELRPEEIAALIRERPARWQELVRAMGGTVEQFRGAVASQDVDALLEIGGTLYENCESCHQEFWYPKR